MPDDRKLCSLCIADGPLREWFEEHGTEDSCDFDQDHDSANCATVDEFAEGSENTISPARKQSKSIRIPKVIGYITGQRGSRSKV
jgi:hypothetical protein